MKTFDPKLVTVLIAGVPITGFADGELVTVEKNEDEWGYHVGADGEVTRVRQRQPMYTVTVRLAGSSLSNAILDAFRRLDLQTSYSPVSVSIIDALGGQSFFAREAWCAKDPGWSPGRDLGEPEWVYHCADGEMVHRGNI